MVYTSPCQTQSKLVNSEPGSDSKTPSSQQEDGGIMRQEETLDNPEREVVVEEDGIPSKFTMKEMIQDCKQMVNRPTTPSQIYLETKYEQTPFKCANTC